MQFQQKVEKTNKQKTNNNEKKPEKELKVRVQVLLNYSTYVVQNANKAKRKQREGRIENNLTHVGIGKS